MKIVLRTSSQSFSKNLQNRYPKDNSSNRRSCEYL